MNKKSLLVLVLILFIGFCLRFYKLANLPLYGDELTMVYDSYSLLRTGKDQLGNFLPLTFKMGAGRPAGYVYFSIPFVAIFGPTAWGVRFLSFLSGLGIIILIYFLGKKLFNERIGLIASLFTAVSFWDISLSRVGFEAHFALFLALLGIVSLLYSKGRPWMYVVFSLSWGLSIHTYPVYKLVLFLFLPFLFFYVFEDLKVSLKDKKSFFPILISIFLGFFAIALSLNETFKGFSEERFLSINVFSRKDIRDKITSEVVWERSLVKLPDRIEIFVSNKAFYYSKLLISSYLNNFSPQFLFVSGDNNPRHNLFEFGQMYYADFLLIFLGVLTFAFMMFKTKNFKPFLFVFSWLFIAPLGSFLLLEEHALRNSFMLPPLLLISALGFYQLFEKRKNVLARLGLFAVCFLVFFQLVLGFARANFLLPYKNADLWSYQARDVFEFVSKVKNKYDYVFLSKSIENIEYAYEVYGKVDPKEVQRQNQENPKIKGFWVRNFDNIFIVDVPNKDLDFFIESCSGRCLFIGDFVTLKDVLSDYKVINFRMGTRPILIKESYKK